MATKVDGLLFDKDGTLFDFHTTWSSFGNAVIRDLAGDDPALLDRLAARLEFDLLRQEFAPTSIFIADSSTNIAKALADEVKDRAAEDLENYLMMSAAGVPQTPAIPLTPFLTDMAAHKLILGVVTNDNEYAAREHLKSVGVDGHFDFVAGCDSGFGAKPDPGPLLAFSTATGLVPSRVAMVGDSTHDLIAGRAAGMQTIGVLTGLATADHLMPYADVIFPDIGHIRGWLHG